MDRLKRRRQRENALSLLMNGYRVAATEKATPAEAAMGSADSRLDQFLEKCSLLMRQKRAASACYCNADSPDYQGFKHLTLTVRNKFDPSGARCCLYC